MLDSCIVLVLQHPTDQQVYTGVKMRNACAGADPSGSHAQQVQGPVEANLSAFRQQYSKYLRAIEAYAQQLIQASIPCACDLTTPASKELAESDDKQSSELQQQILASLEEAWGRKCGWHSEFARVACTRPAHAELLQGHCDSVQQARSLLHKSKLRCLHRLQHQLMDGLWNRHQAITEKVNAF